MLTEGKALMQGKNPVEPVYPDKLFKLFGSDQGDCPAAFPQLVVKLFRRSFVPGYLGEDFFQAELVGGVDVPVSPGSRVVCKELLLEDVTEAGQDIYRKTIVLPVLLKGVGPHSRQQEGPDLCFAYHLCIQGVDGKAAGDVLQRNSTAPLALQESYIGKDRTSGPVRFLRDPVPQGMPGPRRLSPLSRQFFRWKL